MCGSMVDIQSPTAEIRRGKKRKKKKRQDENMAAIINKNLNITKSCTQFHTVKFQIGLYFLINVV